VAAVSKGAKPAETDRWLPGRSRLFRPERDGVWPTMRPRWPSTTNRRHGRDAAVNGFPPRWRSNARNGQAGQRLLGQDPARLEINRGAGAYRHWLQSSLRRSAQIIPGEVFEMLLEPRSIAEGGPRCADFEAPRNRSRRCRLRRAACSISIDQVVAQVAVIGEARGWQGPTRSAVRG